MNSHCLHTSLVAALGLALAACPGIAAAQAATDATAATTAPPTAPPATTATAQEAIGPETTAPKASAKPEPDAGGQATAAANATFVGVKPGRSASSAGNAARAVSGRSNSGKQKPVMSAPVNTRDIAQQVAAISAAIHAGTLAQAQLQLDQLATKLPARSLTLLRLQAWYAHASGDTAQAAALYREVLARLPDDLTASINLAILEAGNGQAESARRRLRQLRAQESDSRTVEHAIRQVEALLR